MATLKYDSELTRELYRMIALEIEEGLAAIALRVLGAGGVIGVAVLTTWTMEGIFAESGDVESNMRSLAERSVEDTSRHSLWDLLGVWMPVAGEPSAVRSEVVE